MKILVVDDDENIRDVVGLILRARGYEVDEAADGIEALDRMRDGSLPAMILLDMMMPRLDGEGVVAAMRGDARLAAIPVVVLSGHQSVREYADRLGAAGCLVKPVELADLLATVRRIGGR